MPKGAKCKKTLRKERMRALAAKSNDKQGCGVFSRLPGDIPVDFKVYGQSRGTSGQTMIAVDTPNGSFRSYREAIDASVGETDNLNISADSGLDMSFCVTDGDYSSDEGDVGISDEENVNPEQLVCEENGIPEGYFITDNAALDDFVTEINRTSQCRTPECQGKTTAMLKMF